jgi:hypothetical protein
MIRRAATAPKRYSGMVTVVMSLKRASRVSLIPATEMSSGTPRPACRRAAIAPRAVSSLAPMTASGRLAPASI